ncbi:MAG: TonB-dependent receptor [Gemmatimonadota bacterium]
MNPCLSRTSPSGVRPVFIFALVAGFLFLVGGHALSAQTGTIRASVEDTQGRPLASATVRVDGTTLGAFTNTNGVATISGVPLGERSVTASLLGYREQRATVTVTSGSMADVRIALVSSPLEVSGIQVSVLRPNLSPDVRVDDAQLQEANPHDIGAVMRTLPGLDAIRRGGLGLDPVVRGLRDTQVGAYVDGMRTLSGGPGGMDTPLSHVDPSAIKGMEVMKGPYALTWGAGNMSAIRVETQQLPARGAAPVSGRFRVGHDTNLSATESGLELAGAGERLAYNASGAWRESGNYVSGDGLETPSEFTSSEVRGRLGLFAAPASTLTLSGWYQAQRDIDYPGRPLDAEFFDAYNASLRWNHAPASGAMRSFDAMAYYYTVDHAMNNDEKPTALANPDRMPPFPMDIVTAANVEMLGGRLSTELSAGNGWTFEVGGDGYTAMHDAASTVENRDTDMLMMERVIWGGARLTNVGVFAKADRPIGRVSASGTVRLDRVAADADSASTFFLDNASSELASTETNVSGALTLSLPVTSAWSVSAGVGSVVRSADANERFSDRSPSKRAQIGAEFLGDPGLRPERSTQVDLWLEAQYSRWAGSLNVFAQRIDDNITIEETDLPRRSPMSAPTVYRYVNGDARYRGAEASARVALTGAFSASASTAYLWGEDVTLDEPALGVSPWRGDLGLRWEPRAEGRFIEVTGRVVSAQERISTTRGEQTTPGYETFDVQGGVPLVRGIVLRGGVNNVFDRAYANHLNSRSPFTGRAVAEPGRVFFARMSVRF